jgi:hypothetical protein
MKAKPQADLVFPERQPPTIEQQRALAAATYENEVLPLVAAAIARITSTRAAALFDARPSYLADALAQRQDKEVRLAWLVALLLDAPDANKLELLSKLCEIAGYRAPERSRQLTDGEENRMRKAALRRHAPALADLIDREIEET